MNPSYNLLSGPGGDTIRYTFALTFPDTAYAVFKLTAEFNAWNRFVKEFAGDQCSQVIAPAIWAVTDA
jgi:hypothetical protein